MLLNRLEFFLMNNPIRGIIQRKIEMENFRAMRGSGPLDTVLEIGCGNGRGARLIRDVFKSPRVVAIDLDPRMIVVARKHNRDPGIDFRVMDASCLDFADRTFDAVFDFGIIHHIPNWTDCLDAVVRVLKPGGEFLAEELSLDSFSGGPGRAWRALLKHPYDRMFTVNEFLDYIGQSGMDITTLRYHNPLGLIKYFSFRAIKIPDFK